MIGRTNAGGGGNVLNYKVVGGTTEPANPKKNTIWVGTEEKITSYVFSPTEPEAPVEGCVWVQIGLNGNAELNALKKNGIILYPTIAYQYNSGSWQRKTAQLWETDTWVDLEFSLYSHGNECANITGGWSEKGTLTSSYPELAQFTKNVTSMRLAAEHKTFGWVVPEKMIDLTNYSTIRFNVISCSSATHPNGGGTYDPKFFIKSVANFNPSYEGNVVNSSIVKTGFNRVDVSALTGLFYICFMCLNYAGLGSVMVTIDEVVCE